MSPEYRLYVSVRSKDDQEFQKARQAILMIKGVNEALVNEWPVMPASEDHIYEAFLGDLGMLHNQPVSGGWIRSKLPNLTRYNVRDWIKSGYVPVSMEHSGKGRSRMFTTKEAELFGKIWYLRENNGIPPKEGSIMAKKEMENYEKARSKSPTNKKSQSIA